MSTSVLTETPSLGANSMPAIVANEDPRIQDNRRTAVGLIFCSASRFGSSTTAVVALPNRVRPKNANNANAETRQKTVTMMSP